jgi:hypothetical protein
MSLEPLHMPYTYAPNVTIAHQIGSVYLHRFDTSIDLPRELIARPRGARSV